MDTLLYLPKKTPVAQNSLFIWVGTYVGLIATKESLCLAKVHKPTTCGQTSPQNVVKPTKSSQGSQNEER